LLILVGLGVGVFLYFRFSNQSLVEKQLELNEQKFVLLVPKNLGFKETVNNNTKVLGFGRGEDISAVGLSHIKLSSLESADKIAQISCKQAFVAVVEGKSLKVCADKESKGDIFLHMDLIENTNVYNLSVITKADYFESNEGQNKIKRIFGSLSRK